MTRTLIFASLCLLSACADKGAFPSLNPRPIEAKAATLLDEKAPALIPILPSDPAMAARITAIRQSAAVSLQQFEAARIAAEKAVSSAGERESESWIAGQMSISALESARAPVKTALSDLEALLRGLLTAPRSEDLDQVRHALENVEEMDARQNAAVQALIGQINR